MKNRVLRFCVIILCFVLALSVFSACSKEEAENDIGLLKDGTLQIGMEIGYPPFELFSDDGKTPIGLDVELGAALAELLGVEVEYVNTAWDGIFSGLDVDKYDCVISAVTIDADRKLTMDFTDSYIENWQAIVVKKGTAPVESMLELNGLTVGYQDETASDKILEDLRDTGEITCEVAEYDKVINCFDDLRLGRVDAVLTDSTVAEGYVAREPDMFEMTWIQSEEPDAVAERFGIALKKGNDKLCAALNQALATLEENGRLDEIREDWLS